MKHLTILLSLISLSFGGLLMDYKLSDDMIELMSFKEQSKLFAWAPCNDIQFNYCQHQFNEFFGLPETTSYRNGSMIFDTVQKYLEMNVTEVVKVCNARTRFYQCLGDSYFSCVNLYYLGNKPNPNLSQIFDYVRTLRGMEYMCVGGFQEVVYQWDCLGTFPTTKAYKNCVQTFNYTVSADKFCETVGDASRCMGEAYHQACGDNGAAYFGCENFRTTFDNACWNLRCNVKDI